jgi:hypothetical protein
LAESLNQEGIEAGRNELVVVAFEKGRFQTSQAMAIITRDKNEFYTFSQETVDKKDIKEIVNCSEYGEEDSFKVHKNLAVECFDVELINVHRKFW